MPPRVRGRYPRPASGTRAWRPWSRYTPSGAPWPAPEPSAGTIPAPGRTTSCMTASPALRSRRAGCRTLHRGRATGHDATSPSDPQTWIAVSPARGSRVKWKEWHCYRCNASRGLPMRSRKRPHPLVMRQAGRTRLPAVRRSVSAVRYVLERAPGPDTTPRDSSRSWLPSARSFVSANPQDTASHGLVEAFVTKFGEQPGGYYTMTLDAPLDARVAPLLAISVTIIHPRPDGKPSLGPWLDDDCDRVGGIGRAAGASLGPRGAAQGPARRAPQAGYLPVM